jgi:hypothetical protein
MDRNRSGSFFSDMVPRHITMPNIIRRNTIMSFTSIYNPEHEKYKTILINIMKNGKMTSFINLLLQYPGDYVERIRFCSSVLEYENSKISNDKYEKAICIQNVFFKSGMFKIKSISNKDIQSVSENYNYLIIVKNNIINDLVNDVVIRENIDKFE